MTLQVLVDGDKEEHVGMFTYLSSRITNGADCRHNMKTRFTMNMAAMVKLTKGRKTGKSTNTKLLTDENVSVASNDRWL